MATENQDFFKHLEDTFELVFEITDVAVSLNSFRASWYCSTSPTSSVLIQKNTNPTFDAGTGGSPTGVGDITISGTTVTVALNQTDFTTGAPGGNGISTAGDYYHELTLGQAANGSDSVVVASGIWTVKDALFDHR